MTVTVEPVSRVSWDEVERVFGTRGDASRCWCQWFKLPNASWEETAHDERRAALRRQQADDPGLVLRVDGEAVGWVAVEPRICYPRLAAGRTARASGEPVDAADVWAVTCFVVRVGHRRRGIAGALLRAAIEHARSGGARVLEAYPVAVSPGDRASSASLYHGTVSMFVAEGFETVARPSGGRTVMRLELGTDGSEHPR